MQGSLDSQGNSLIVSEVEGSATILTIVPEGTRVETGDVICKLDSAMLEDQAKQQEITVLNASAAEVQASEALQVQRTQNQTDIAAAELKLTLAKLDLRKYQEGEYQKLQKEKAGAKALAEEELTQARESHEFTKRMVKLGYKNQNELEAARIQVEKSQLAVEKASEELKVLEQFEKERMITELEYNADEFVRELDRAKIKAKAAETQAMQAYDAAKKSAELEQEKLTKLRDQIAKCTLVAPQAGEVVYANLPSQSRRGGSEGPAIQEGATVRERQPIIALPDVTRMKVDCRAHESLIGYLRTGLTAKIRVDAFPEESFRGEVATVSSVPMTGRFPNYDLREYEVAVNLVDEEGKVRKLRPGLTAQLEILVASRTDVLQVPMQGVVGVGGKYFGWVLTQTGPQRRELKIGQTNETDIEIVDGLNEGEPVILSPRVNFATEIAELETQLGAEKQESLSEEGVPETLGPPVQPGAGPDSPGGPGGGGPPGSAGQGRPGGGGGFSPAQMLERRDTNKDGKLSADEVAEQMKPRFAELDANGDGGLDASELGKLIQSRQAAGGGGGPGGGGPGGGGPGGGGPGIGGPPAGGGGAGSGGN
jgi:HlyD family secretion protein